MNSNIIYLGPQETVVGGTITRPILIIHAESDLVITGLVYIHQAAPAAPGKVAAFTLGAGRYLTHVKGLTFTGTATIIYKN